MLAVAWLCALSTFSFVLASDSLVPSSWQGTTVNVTRDQRFSLAQSALDAITPSINSSFSTLEVMDSAFLLWGYTLQDMFSGQRASQNLVATNMSEYNQTYSTGFWGTDHDTRDVSIWGVVAAYAYKVYSDMTFLKTAESIWNEVFPYFVTPTQAQTGVHPTRNVTFQSACNGATVAGAVFYNATTPNDLRTEGALVGSFLALSAYLYEATQNTTYSTAAALASSFIQNHLYNGAVIVDGFALDSCLTSTDILTFETGLAIEGLSAWANISSSATLANFTQTLVNSSTGYSVWTSRNGVINGDFSTANLDDFPQAYKGFLVRGLHTALTRLDLHDDIAALVEAYIAVQFNALLNTASNPGANIYSSNWAQGPPPNAMDPVSQIAAIHVLTTASTLTNDGSNGSSTSGEAPQTSQSVSPAPSSPKSDIGAIVGGAVGGAALVAALALAIFWLRRRRRARRSRMDIVEDPRTDPTEVPYGPLSQVEPFPWSPHTETHPDTSSATSLHRSDLKSTPFLPPGPASLSPIHSEAQVRESSARQGLNLEEILRSEAVGRLVEQRVVDVLARAQAPISRSGGGEQPPEYVER